MNKNPAVTGDITQPKNTPFTVGIGASAGGLEALEDFFKSLPSDTGMAFVVIQHLSPDFKSMMDELLSRCTDMPICLVRDKEVIQPNTIFLLPPRKNILINNGELYSVDKSSDEVLHLPINIFLRSLAENCGERSAGIILSGTGSDGSLGIRHIKEHGGLVLVQDELSAKFDGMPRSAILTGCVDAILCPGDMPRALYRFSNQISVLQDSSDSVAHEDDNLEKTKNLIIEKLREVYDIDFSCYKPGTIWRRIERRVSLTGQTDMQSYYRFLQDEPEELDKLYKDLLIGVTRFYRDEKAFSIIENDVIPDIIKSVPEHEDVRIWVPGCATGEEPYSLAILFLEEFERQNRTPRLKIFASDMHRDSLQIAGEGVYLSSSLEDLRPEIAAKYFINQEDGTFRVIAALRKALIFSAHNLIKDPPFTQIDMVSCRNLLIYFQSSAQRRVIDGFVFSLRRNGYLFLGPSEGTGDLQNDFEIIDRQWKIFKKIGDTRRPHGLGKNVSITTSSRNSKPLSNDFVTSRVYDSLLVKYIKRGVLINDRREIIHIFGDATNYLHIPTGRPSQDILNLLDGELRIAVSSAVQNCLKTKQQVIYQHIFILGKQNSVQITVDPIEDPVSGSHFLMIIFTEELPKENDQEAAQVFVMHEEVGTRIQQLEQELHLTKESLQTAVEQLEASNEELQASNEELLASNEELQSTNEELHSVNEELYSVNAEHELKIRELNNVTSDLNNLIRATNVGSIFLALDGRIRLFTPEASRLFNLLPQDIGRDIRHITSKIRDDDIGDDLESVLETNCDVLKRVATPTGNIFMRKVSSYFDLDKKPVGVVISFVDITSLAYTEEMLSNQTRLLVNITGNLPCLIAYWDKDKICQYSNHNMKEWLGIDATHRDIVDVYAGRSSSPFADFASQALENQKQLFEQIIVSKNNLPVHCQTHYIPDVVGKEIMGFVELTIDISNQKQLEKILAEKVAIAERASQAKSEFVANVSHELRTPLNVVLGMVQMMSAEEPTPKQLEYLKDIEVAGKGLLSVINEILDFAKIDSGKMGLDIEPCDMESVMDDLYTLLASMAQSKGLSWEIKSDFKTDSHYFMDSTKFERAVMNLISNAVKFTEKGTITLEVRIEKTDPEYHWIRVSVKDTGIGIPKQVQMEIFRAFSQADASITRRYGGTGLGLAITRKIVELMGGEIGLFSEEGKGSEFWFHIPLRVPSEQESNTCHAPILPAKGHIDLLQQTPLENLKVLVVDDFDLNRRFLDKMLRQTGAKPIEACNGQEALEILKKNPEIDVVLMDLQMPVMSGLQATRYIRRELNMPSLPIIAISAGVLQEEQLEAIKAGMNSFLPKPIDILSVVSEILRVTKKSDLKHPVE